MTRSGIKLMESKHCIYLYNILYGCQNWAIYKLEIDQIYQTVKKKVGRGSHMT